MEQLRRTLDELSDTEIVTNLLRERIGPDVKVQRAMQVFLAEAQVREITPLLEVIPDSNEPHVVGLYGRPNGHVIHTLDALPPESSGELVESYGGVIFSYRHPVESTQAWLDYRHEDDAKKLQGQIALSVHRKLRRRKTISLQDLEHIMLAIRSPYMVSWEPGKAALAKLAGQHAAARDAWETLLNDRKAKVRERALFDLGDELPKSFCLKILRKGLRDRSKEVRRISAHYAEVHSLEEMLDDLIDLKRTENNADVQYQLEYSIDMFQQRFHYNKQYGSLWVRYDDDSVRSISGQRYNRAYFESHDLKAVAEEIRREFPLKSWERRRKPNWPDEAVTG